MNKRKLYRTDFLVSSSDFLMGVGSIFNVSGNYYSFNYSNSGREADTKAIESDWGVVGQDIKKSINKISQLAPNAQLELDFHG